MLVSYIQSLVGFMFHNHAYLIFRVGLKVPKGGDILQGECSPAIADMSLAVSPVKLLNGPHFPRLPDNTDTT